MKITEFCEKMTPKDAKRAYEMLMNHKTIATPKYIETNYPTIYKLYKEYKKNEILRPTNNMQMEHVKL